MSTNPPYLYLQLMAWAHTIDSTVFFREAMQTPIELLQYGTLGSMYFVPYAEAAEAVMTEKGLCYQFTAAGLEKAMGMENGSLVMDRTGADAGMMIQLFVSEAEYDGMADTMGVGLQVCVDFVCVWGFVSCVCVCERVVLCVVCLCVGVCALVCV